METRANSRQTGLAIGIILIGVLCVCVGAAFQVGGAAREWLAQIEPSGPTRPQDSPTAELTVAVSPGMVAPFQGLVETFNARAHKTPDGSLMQVRVVSMVPEQMVEESLGTPAFQALAPDSSLWLSLLDRQWAATHAADDTSVIPIGRRRFGEPVRYATSPIVIAAWESTARELGWPEKPIGWEDIQNQATGDPNFKWNHPSTGHASGLLATLAEFYAGAGLTRGLTAELATAESTLEYVRAVEATIRFYGEGEDVIVQRLAEEGKNFLDAFVTQERVVLAWNRHPVTERLVAIYPAEGTMWADHPLALLELSGPGETPVTDNQRRTYRALVEHLLASEAQQYLLEAGYRPADMDIRLDEGDSPFANTNAVDWRQPQTTLQIPPADVVEVVQNVWWYTKRPTNIVLVVDVSGSMSQYNRMPLTQAALRSFVTQIQGDRDQVGLITFASRADIIHPIQPLDAAGRQEMLTVIDRLRPQGQTALIDGVVKAHNELVALGDTEAINAIVVMTDGMENASANTMESLRRRLDETDEPTIVIFTIAFGVGSDESIMRELANIGGGQFWSAGEAEIEELYKIISTYF